MDFIEERAEKAEERGDLALALQLWKDLAESSREPVFFCRLGRVAQEMEKWNEAEDAFTNALRIDPAFALAMEGLGDLWATRTDKSEARPLEVAKRWFLEALRRERSARTLTFLGSTYIALDDGAAARDAFEEAVLLDPNYEEALYNLAITEKENDPEGAIELFERAILIDPDYFVAQQELGKLYQKAGDIPRAEYHFRRSLEIETNEYWSLLYLANVLAVQGKNSEAEQTYRLVTGLYPEKKDAAVFFARFLESIGREAPRL